MKKLYYILLCLLLITPTLSSSIKANTPSFLIYLGKDSDFYRVEIKENTMHVYIFSKYIYMPIAPLHDTFSTLQEIDFMNAPTALSKTLETLYIQNKDTYIFVDMKNVLHDLKMEDMYSYDTISSLRTCAQEIIDKNSIKQILNYKKYIQTNASLETLYDLYTFCKNKNFKIKYHHLMYLKSNNKYIVMNAQFS